MEITTDYSNVKWQENGKLKAFVSLFGRDTLAELDFSDVIKN